MSKKIVQANDPRFANPVCQQCIRDNLEKYRGFIGEEGLKYVGFPIQCKGIPVNYVNDSLRAVLSPDEVQQATEVLDPVSWAAKNVTMPSGLPWVARWYQEVMLRCTARRRVLRLGRRTGKTDTLVIKMLSECCTHESKRFLVITPYKSQSEEIFGRLRTFIYNNPSVQQSVTRDVGSPHYEIVFSTKSRIRAFSSGVKSGSEAAQVRGQDADCLVLDEADYLDEGDLTSLTAVLATNANVDLWASSTPTGARSNFWRWCTQTPTYKEFYHPTSVLPHWEEIKDQVRADYAGNKDGWSHEILAEFGEQTVGVFQHQYVDNAILDYQYQNQLRRDDWVYGIGIDWNSDVGTEIAVVGYDGHAVFHVVEAINVPKQGWTQLAGLERVIEMHAKWLPNFIYADEGAGLTNIEMLRKYGYDCMARPGDPGVRLKDIVKAYNFSSKIDSHDPLTKQPIKKHAKPFLVENAVRFFEEGRIKISAHDQVLKNQLANYIVKHRTAAGIPVYAVLEEKIGDHRLDAFMLALVGFKLEMSDFGRPNYTTQVSITPGFSKGAGGGQEFDPRKELKSRLERVPTQRTTVEHGVTGQTTKLYRHGFDTDTEAEHLLRYRMNKLRKSGRRGARPTRTNLDCY